jgi:hypothetical protein
MCTWPGSSESLGVLPLHGRKLPSPQRTSRTARIWPGALLTET